MMPYSKKKLYDIALSLDKKVDIFDCHAMGWK